ncbi:unnamed protein product [Durusdinium trenchii]|uniref:Uncharacterized protein n=1 Tax=Durusdinium trenchii TaxID=1381693 RepID=A0ABP0P9U0_9DINO
MKWGSPVALPRSDELWKNVKRIAKSCPPEVEEVIAEGTYLESFLEAFDGQSFLLHSEEIAPSHEYRLALEVNSGGAYWKSIPVFPSRCETSFKHVTKPSTV